MVLRVQWWRTPVRRRRVHGLLLNHGPGCRVTGGVRWLYGQSGHRWPRGQWIDRTAGTGTRNGAASGGRLVRVELQPESCGQRWRGHMTTVVLGTADGRRADPATPGIRRLVHRPCGVLTHWRRDGCSQPVPGMINARLSTGAAERVDVLQPAVTTFHPPILCPW